jgi:transcriptional regulator with XRE-family HTH domain
MLPHTKIGDRLREARTANSLSLRALGELTGFSASFLSQVELGQTMPSLGSLQRISEALGLTVANLLSAEEATAPAPAPVTSAIVRKGSRGALRSEWSKATVEPLVQASADEKLQAMLVRLDPEGKTGVTSYAPGRRLFAYCTTGSAVATLSEPVEELVVEAGDSVVVDGPRTVAWQNRSAALAELLVVAARIA